MSDLPTMSDGFVYFVAPENLLNIRIGFTSGPPARLKTLQTWSPVKLILLCCVPGSRGDERMLHWLFAARRTHGDWFDASPEILACIAYARALGRIPVRLRAGIQIPKLDYSGRTKRRPQTPEERARRVQAIRQHAVWRKERKAQAADPPVAA